MNEDKLHQPPSEYSTMTNDQVKKVPYWMSSESGQDDAEYQEYKELADNGWGGDITRGGAPLLLHYEWTPMRHQHAALALGLQNMKEKEANH